VIRGEAQDDGDLDTRGSDRAPDVDRKVDAVPHLDPDPLEGEFGIVPLIRLGSARRKRG
jgi:hypothetical protein